MTSRPTLDGQYQMLMITMIRVHAIMKQSSNRMVLEECCVDAGQCGDFFNGTQNVSEAPANRAYSGVHGLHLLILLFLRCRGGKSL